MTYHFDENKAERAARFFEQELRYVEGVKAGQPFSLEGWQKKIVRDLFGWVRDDGTRRYRMAYIEVPRKNGKALAVDTPVPTPDGWKMHGDLRPGDFVFAPDGQHKMVQAVTQHYVGRCRSVVFSDGETIIAHDNHEWKTDRTWYTGRNKGSRAPMPLVTTEQIAQTLRQAGRGDLVHSIKVAKPLQCEAAILPIPPYTMGIWIGDGTSNSADFTTADKEVVAAIRSEGIAVKKRPPQYLFSMSGDRSHASRIQSVQSRLRAMGVLGNKHIPQMYLRSSVSQRRDLLAGIVDSDGHVTPKGQCEICLTSQRIVTDVVELCRTLGYKPTVKESRARLNGKDVGPRWRIQFWPSVELPLRIHRKKERLMRRGATRSQTRKITSCESCGDRMVNCIQVEGGMYLAGQSMIPTHNSTFAAGLALYLLLCDKEARPQVYSCAGDRDQARIVFNAARQMVEHGTETLKAAAQLRQYQIRGTRNDGWYEACSAEAYTGHGKNPHGIIFDELHVQPNRDLWDSMLSGRGARSQPLVIAITTAGHDRSSICWEVHQRAKAAIERPDEDPTFYGVIYGAEPGEDWTSEDVWRKANPNLGVSVSLDFLREECTAAKDNPAHENVFRNLYLNQWTEQAVRWIPMHMWDSCKIDGLSLDEFAGQPCWCGLDLAATRDINALSLVFRRDERYYAFFRFWMPEEPIDIRSKQDRSQAKRWAQLGHIVQTEGNVADYATICQDICDIASRFDVQQLAYDPWGPARALAQQLTALGFALEKLIEFRQTMGTFASPSKIFERLVTEGTLHHNGDPVMRWMVSNVAAERDANDNIRPSKSKSADKIDGVVATIMALGLAGQGIVNKAWDFQPGTLAL